MAPFSNSKIRYFYLCCGDICWTSLEAKQSLWTLGLKCAQWGCTEAVLDDSRIFSQDHPLPGVE